METFWQKLPEPFFVLAPLADVTDPAFRRLVAEVQAPDVMWTEFVSADGLMATRTRNIMEDAQNPLMRDLRYSAAERPIVAQLFSSNPEAMAYAAELCARLGFDGIDINMGCPDQSIERQGCGAAMIKNPLLAKEIIRAARMGAAKGKEGGIPVSVKTRIGYNTETLDEWIPALLEEGLPALTVHLRTRKEMSKVAAHWELMPRIVALRDKLAPDTLIIGNGDVKDMEDAKSKIAESGCDGVMFGRAVFGNPWLFTGRTLSEITPREKLEALLRLAEYFGELEPRKSFHILKKHFKSFISGWPEAALLRTQLMEAAILSDIESPLRRALELLS